MSIYNQNIGKKLAIFMGITLLSIAVKAQLFRSYIDLNDYNYDNNLGSLYINRDFKKQEVKEVITKYVNPKNNQLQSSGIYKLDKNGVGYFYQYFNKKGQIYLTRTYHLIDTLKFDKAVSAYKRDTFTTINLFNNANKISEIQYYNKKNQKTSFYKFTYNETNKLATSVGFNKKGKQTYKNEYEYYDNGSRKETRYFNKKNVLKKIYSYACEPTGTIEKKVTLQNICKKRTYNADGSYIEIFEGHDNKGHTSRRVVKYSSDSLELAQTFYNNKDQETWRYVSEYNNRKPVTFSRFYKGKLRKTYYYTYKPNGLTESYKVVNAKGKVKRNTVYEYSYFSL